MTRSLFHLVTRSFQHLGIGRLQSDNVELMARRIALKPLESRCRQSRIRFQ
jgi:hypothetical protein